MADRIRVDKQLILKYKDFVWGDWDIKNTHNSSFIPPQTLPHQNKHNIDKNQKLFNQNVGRS